jgi:hypothetical protein
VGVESGLVMSVMQNNLEVSQVFICNFSVFHMKKNWLKIRMMVVKNIYRKKKGVTDVQRPVTGRVL